MSEGIVQRKFRTRKLVLYSEQMLPETAGIDQRLLALIGKERPQIGYIPSAGDLERKYYRSTSPCIVVPTALALRSTAIRLNVWERY